MIALQALALVAGTMGAPQAAAESSLCRLVATVLADTPQYTRTRIPAKYVVLHGGPANNALLSCPQTTLPAGLAPCR